MSDSTTIDPTLLKAIEKLVERFGGAQVREAVATVSPMSAYEYGRQRFLSLKDLPPRRPY